MSAGLLQIRDGKLDADIGKRGIAGFGKTLCKINQTMALSVITADLMSFIGKASVTGEGIAGYIPIVFSVIFQCRNDFECTARRI